MKLFSEGFLNTLKKENENIDLNLDLNEEMLETGLNKNINIEQLIYILRSNNKPSHLSEYLKIKEKEHPILKKFLNNIENRIQLLNKLKEYKEMEINLVKRSIKK